MSFVPKTTNRDHMPLLLVTLAICVGGCNQSSDRSPASPHEQPDSTAPKDDLPDSTAPKDSTAPDAPDDNTDVRQCAPGTVCDAYTVCKEDGECARGCIIDGVFRAEGELNPSNPCEACYMDSQTGWSGRRGSACHPPEASLCDSSEGCVSLHGVSAGNGTCAISSGGGLMCWGLTRSTDAGNVRTPVPGLESDVVAVSYRGAGFCAITSEGGVWCGGRRVFGSVDCPHPPCANEFDNPTGLPIEVIAPGSGTVAVSPGIASHAVTSTGGVVCWGVGCNGDYYSVTREPVPISGLDSRVVEVTTGCAHACALTETGGVVCWGQNIVGQLGLGWTSGYHAKPTAVPGLEAGVVAVSAGCGHTCALKSTKDLVCWGFNDVGQIDPDNTDHKLSPWPMYGLGSDVAQVSAGWHSTCVLSTAGAVKCWPYQSSWDDMADPDQADRIWLGPVPGLESGVSAITLGTDHICADVSGHGIVCLGCNDGGQLGPQATHKQCRID